MFLSASRFASSSTRRLRRSSRRMPRRRQTVGRLRMSTLRFHRRRFIAVFGDYRRFYSVSSRKRAPTGHGGSVCKSLRRFGAVSCRVRSRLWNRSATKIVRWFPRTMFSFVLKLACNSTRLITVLCWCWGFADIVLSSWIQQCLILRSTRWTDNPARVGTSGIGNSAGVCISRTGDMGRVGTNSIANSAQVCISRAGDPTRVCIGRTGNSARVDTYRISNSARVCICRTANSSAQVCAGRIGNSARIGNSRAGNSARVGIGRTRNSTGIGTGWICNTAEVSINRIGSPTRVGTSWTGNLARVGTTGLKAIEPITWVGWCRRRLGRCQWNCRDFFVHVFIALDVDISIRVLSAPRQSPIFQHHLRFFRPFRAIVEDVILGNSVVQDRFLGRMRQSLDVQMRRGATVGDWAIGMDHAQRRHGEELIEIQIRAAQELRSWNVVRRETQSPPHVDATVDRRIGSDDNRGWTSRRLQLVPDGSMVSRLFVDDGHGSVVDDARLEHVWLSLRVVERVALMNRPVNKHLQLHPWCCG